MSTWKDELPDDLKASPALKDITDVKTLAKTYVDQQVFLGSSLRLPGPDAGDDDRKAFHTKLLEKVPGLIPTPNPDDPELMGALFRKFGQPEKPDGYTLPKDVEPPEEDVKALREIAHKAGLSNKQFQHMVKELHSINATSQQLQEIETQNGIKNLRNEWGIAFEDRLSLAQKALVVTKAPQTLVDAVKDGTAGPDTIKWLHGLAKQIGAEGINMAGAEGGASINVRLTPIEARAQIQEMLNNHDHPYWKGDMDARNKMVELHKMADPSLV